MAETVVAGMIVGEFIADFCERSENAASIPAGLVQETLQREQAKIDALVDSRGTENAAALMAEMQTIMTGKVGIFRTGRVLDYLNRPNRKMCSLYLSLLDRAGVRLDRFGDSQEPLGDI